MPVVSADQANLVVDILKKIVKESIHKVKSKRVHLFYAGPVHVALFLGHRWNTLGTLQCYEWLGTGQYVPTCSIQQ